MKQNLAQTLMDEFAESTGVTGESPPRRYLWTDAFAVYNFLGLHKRTGDDRSLRLALDLIDQVHHVLGRHRADDSRQGWISGLSGTEAERHPTRGGLRIGKKLNERGAGEPADPQLEWDRDGQYFHYLTKWMHALYCAGRATSESRYPRWAAELAVTAHRAFTYETSPGGAKRMFWKMSVDLSRPLVESMGHHDPLDGLVTCLQLESAGDYSQGDEFDLSTAIDDFGEMCAARSWATSDPLGIGGLLCDAARLCELVFEHGVERRDLLAHLLEESSLSLENFSRTFPLNSSAEYRLAFRELGLAIGLHGLEPMRRLISDDPSLAPLVQDLMAHRRVADQIEAFWSEPAHRRVASWSDHGDINAVMLATSLAPEGFFA